ncbi:MAG: GNAT family N-acetyltransferase [Burkholderiaceae bacterium]
MQTTLAKSNQTAYEHTFTPPFGRMNNNHVTTSVFENEIPSYVEREMDRLYGNLYSSFSKIRANGSMTDVSTYVVYNGSEIVTVFLFRITNGKATLLNEVIEISEEEISRFVQTVFEKFSHVNCVSFVAIKADLEHVTFPYQRINYLEDIIVTLPESVDQYLAVLKKNTRRNIKRYTNRLKTNLPSFNYEIYVKDGIDEQDIRDIIKLNHARMSGKNNTSALGECETERMIKLVRECGLVCVARNEGKVCAGAISFRVGENYFLKVLAHDPLYNDYSLGILCCFHIICECINRGGREFHFLWGRYDYKYTLLGIQRDLDYLAVYRSRFDYLMDLPAVASTAFKGYMRQTILWAQETKKKEGPIPALVGWSLKRIHEFKRLKMNLAG